MTTKTSGNHKVKDLNIFKQRIEKEFFQHPVIVNNPYTKWFKQGTANTEQVKDLIRQFSVFSNHFIVVQTKRMVNARTIKGVRISLDRTPRGWRPGSGVEVLQSCGPYYRPGAV